MTFKEKLFAFLASVASVIGSFFGGLPNTVGILIVLMIIDYATGFIVAAAFHRSSKSDSGRLDSRAGLKGLCTKGMIITLVYVAALLDDLLGSTFVTDAVALGFCFNETVSILENAGLMGVKYPAAITTALDLLQKKTDAASVTPRPTSTPAAESTEFPADPDDFTHTSGQF